jgi:drug/metabolite transporter (DMT)-like permease
MNKERLAAVVTAVAWVFIKSSRPQLRIAGAELEKASPTGYGLAILAMLGNSGMTIFARRYLRQFDSLDVTSIRLWVGALILMPLYAFKGTTKFSRVDNSGLLALALSALLGTFAGYLLAFYIVKRFSVTASASTFYIVPVVAGLGGVLLLKNMSLLTC